MTSTETLRQNVLRSIEAFVTASPYGVRRGPMSEESTFVDLGMDSLDMVELSMDLEDNLDIDLRGVELSWSTVAEAIDCVVGLKTKAQNV